MSLIWDFDEKKNYISINNYKVIDSRGARQSSEILEVIDTLIAKLQFTLLLSGKAGTDIYLKLLADTPHKVQEMQLPEDQGSIIFEGLNKPKNVRRTKGISIGKDKNYRAKYRIIFLTLRYPSGKFKPLDKLIPLVAHELTHTALNHVTWKDDNHSALFKQYNKIILGYLKQI
tara:strand:+ start:256 stop:774 length:519 start_codon:yes stop_codon:yes gene_type:complete